MTEYKDIHCDRGNLLRPCLAGGKKALFHCWFQETKVTSPFYTVGGHPGGQMSTVLGLVEWEDGTVHAVQTWDIQFTDSRLCMTETEEHSFDIKEAKNAVENAFLLANRLRSKEQHAFAEGVLFLAKITGAVTKERAEQIEEDLEKIESYGYKEQEADL